MNYSKLALSLGMATALVSGVAFANNGKVTFSGSITDTPCSISSESLDQTIKMGDIGSVQLRNSGTSTPKDFQLSLENCDVTTTNDEVQVEFSGTASSATAEHLGIVGTAKGASIAITDGSGNKIKLGEKSTARKLSAGTNTLLFSAYLQGDGPSATITPGDFSAIADVKLTYQ